MWFMKTPRGHSPRGVFMNAKNMTQRYYGTLNPVFFSPSMFLTPFIYSSTPSFRSGKNHATIAANKNNIPALTIAAL